MSSVYFDEELVLLDPECADRESVIRALAGIMTRKGLVRSTFLEAVLERERKLPTGLPSKPVGVAIPHTDPEHCVRPSLAVARLKKPVKFGLMGDSSAQVDVWMVFLLALTSGDEHMNFLCSLTDLFQNASLMEELMAAGDSGRVAALVRQNLKTCQGGT